MHKLFVLISACGLIALSGSALGNAAQHLPVCSGCHGADGATSMMPDVPIIAGIPAIVQEDALFAYRDGARKCLAPGVMCQLASALTDDDIVELSANFAALPYKPAGEDFDAALAAKGKAIHQESCAKCHGMDDPGDAESSILHGQRVAYLRHAIKQYIANEREQLPPMLEKTSALTPEKIEALVNYYASYKLAK